MRIFFSPSGGSRSSSRLSHASRGSGAAKVTIDYLASQIGAGSTILFPESEGRLLQSQAAAQLQADSIPEGTDAVAESSRIEVTALALTARGVIGSLAAIVDAVIAGAGLERGPPPVVELLLPLPAHPAPKRAQNPPSVLLL